MKHFIDEHFAVVVVLFIFTLLFCAYLLEAHVGKTPGSLDWLEGEMKEIIGAILMGLTGKAIINGQRKSDVPPQNEAKK